MAALKLLGSSRHLSEPFEVFLKHNGGPTFHAGPWIDRDTAGEMSGRLGSLELSAGKADTVFWYCWTVRPGDYELQLTISKCKSDLFKQKPPHEAGAKTPCKGKLI